MKSFGVVAMLLLLVWASVCPADIQNHALAIVLTPSIAYKTRAQNIAKINRNLSESDIQAIHRFLRRKDSQGLAPLEINSLKNDLVLALMRQNRHDKDLVELLIEMYGDKEYSIVWRDYCIQFMGRIYPEATLSEQARLKKALQDAVQNSIPSLSVTAMIAVQLNQPDLSLEPGVIRDQALALLKHDIPSYVKVSLFQICAADNIEPKVVLPMLRSIVKESNDVPLKSSAIAALGIYGDKTALELIEPLCTSSDIRIRSAALAARKKLQ